MVANIEKSYGDDKCAYFIMVADDIVGKIGFVDTDDNMGEISYWLAHGFNGRGIMTRALNKLTEMGFAECLFQNPYLLVQVACAKCCQNAIV